MSKVGVMLAQRPGRWANITPTLSTPLVFSDVRLGDVSSLCNDSNDSDDVPVTVKKYTDNDGPTLARCELTVSQCSTGNSSTDIITHKTP